MDGRFAKTHMPNDLGKRIDIEKLVEKYLSRMNNNPDAIRLLLNMLADNVTDITTIRNYIIKYEFKFSEEKPKFNKESMVEKLSETYGLSKRQILEIIQEKAR